MGANYHHTTRSGANPLGGTNYNADHQNHIDNAVPAIFDDYSESVAQMRSMVDPGEPGTESLADSLAGELERLRFMIASITGKPLWYEAPSQSLAAIVPAGTRQPFAQATAPVGYTQDVSDAANNRMLRVVNTAGGGVGGVHSPILNNVVVAHTHSFTTSTESALHTHGVNDPGHAHSYLQPSAQLPQSGSSTQCFVNTAIGTTGTSGSNISLGTQSAFHTHSGTTDGVAGASNWTPRYIDMIICVKN